MKRNVRVTDMKGFSITRSVKISMNAKEQIRYVSCLCKDKLVCYYRLGEEKGSVQRLHYSCIEFVFRSNFLVRNVIKVNT